MTGLLLTEKQRMYSSVSKTLPALGEKTKEINLSEFSPLADDLKVRNNYEIVEEIMLL